MYEVKRNNMGIESTYHCDSGSTKVIYKLTFPNNKIYIGQTKNKLYLRIKQHCVDAFHNDRCCNDVKYRAIRKFKSFNVDVIEQCNSIDDLDNREIEIIKEYKDKGFKLYNVAAGGLNNCEYFCKETLLLDKNFNIFKIFKSRTEATNYLSVSALEISYINDYKLNIGKYFAMYKDDYYSIDAIKHKELRDQQIIKIKEKRDKINRERSIYNCNIVQLDYNYNYISTINCNEAITKYGIQIQRCINNKIKYAYNYYWIKESEYLNYINNDIDISKIYNGLINILLLNKEGTILKNFDTLTSVSKYFNCGITKITNNINNKTKYINGKILMMSDKYNSIEDKKTYFYNYNIYEVKRKIEYLPKVVYKYDINNILIEEYYSLNEASRRLKTNPKTLRNSINKKRPYKGYIYTMMVY